MKDEKEKMKNERRAFAYALVFLFLTAAGIIFTSLVIKYTQLRFIKANPALWVGLCSALLFGGYLFSVYCAWKEKQLLLKSMLSVYVFVLFVLIITFLLQITGFFEVVKDADSLREYIQRAGVWMPLAYILFQFLQVVVLPVPGIVSTIAGIALFGALKTTIFSLIGILTGSFVAFAIGRKLGNKAVSWLLGEETLKKWQTKLKGRDNLILTVMLFLPFFPDDVLCFLAGLSTMSFRFFLIVIVLSRVLAVTATCYSVDFIPFDTPWGIALWVLFIALIIVAFVVIYKNMHSIERWFKKRFRRRKKRKKKDESNL